MEKEILEKIFNEAREGCYTQNGFLYKNFEEWLLDNPDVALSMSGVSDSVPCDYRKAECTNEGNIIKGVWKCSNHQGTDH